MSNALHMHRLSIEARILMEHGRRLRLPLRTVDNGYLVHCVLAGLFGELAPKPFSMQQERGRNVELLGYAAAPVDDLKEHAQRFADPLLYEAVDWSQAASKPMPSTWEKGQRLGFEVRACPVRRLGRGTKYGRPGAEVDAFLAQCWKEGIEEGADRGKVYLAWLSERIEAAGGATLGRTEVAGFERERLVRRRQGTERTAAIAERPDVTFRGELTVTEPEAFSRLLARGIGRHRAFGFGMLLLRPC